MPVPPMNRRAKFDAASFIIGGEIRNRTNKQTHKQTVNDISTPCLSACVDNKKLSYRRGNARRTVSQNIVKCCTAV